jgi:hypothetical protein
MRLKLVLWDTRVPGITCSTDGLRVLSRPPRKKCGLSILRIRKPSSDQFVEQVVVERDSLAGAPTLHIKDQVSHVVARQTHVTLANPPNDSSQSFSPSTHGALIVDRENLLHEVGEAVDPALSSFEHGLNHCLDLFDWNLVDLVLQIGNRVGLKPRILGNGCIGRDRLSQMVERRAFYIAGLSQGTFAGIEKLVVLSPRDARLLWFGCWRLWKTGLFSL